MAMERYQMQPLISKNDNNIVLFLRVFIAVLVISGLCYFSLPFLSKKILGLSNSIGVRGEFYSFASKLSQAATYNSSHYPFMGYSTDLLGFAHLMFALLFVGPILDPDKNEYVVRFGLIVCLLLVPTVLVAGWVREIPMIWIIINCFFGIFGFLLLYKVFKMIKANQKMRKELEAKSQKTINPEIRVA
ncbi:MAG: hypothetical protein NT150_11735 [Bacteroidetes bacterium]|nr:hypothetical protein [Bacteroidota bacterium]